MYIMANDIKTNFDETKKKNVIKMFLWKKYNPWFYDPKKKKTEKKKTEKKSYDDIAFYSTSY